MDYLYVSCQSCGAHYSIAIPDESFGNLTVLNNVKCRICASSNVVVVSDWWDE